jgi:hypothetical protein
MTEMKGKLLDKEQLLKKVKTFLEAENFEGAMKLFDLKYQGEGNA